MKTNADPRIPAVAGRNVIGRLTISGVGAWLLMLTVCSSDASANGTGTTAASLLFPKDDYTAATKTVTTSKGNKAVTYHLYRHITYVASPVDANYESMNVSVPVNIDGVDVDATNAPILLAIDVAGYTSSSNTASGAPSGGGTPPSGGSEM